MKINDKTRALYDVHMDIMIPTPELIRVIKKDASSGDTLRFMLKAIPNVRSVAYDLNERGDKSYLKCTILPGVLFEDDGLIKLEHDMEYMINSYIEVDEWERNEYL